MVNADSYLLPLSGLDKECCRIGLNTMRHVLGLGEDLDTAINVSFARSWAEWRPWVRSLIQGRCPAPACVLRPSEAATFLATVHGDAAKDVVAWAAAEASLYNDRAYWRLVAGEL